MAGALKPSTIRGELNAAGLRFGIVVSQFNNFITDRLLAGALDAMERSGAGEKQIEIVRVPGSFEIPIIAKKLAATNRFDSIVCIGCILRGETSHYDVVVSETARGIQLAQLDSGVPLSLIHIYRMAIERTLAIIKPDAVGRGLTGEILSRCV